MALLTQTPWVTLEQRLPATLNAGVLLSFRDWLYYFGGRTNAASATVSTVYRARVLPNGQTTSWETIGTLPEAASGMGGYIHNGWVYLTSSVPAITVNYQKMIACKLGSDGSLGPWKFIPMHPALYNTGTQRGTAGVMLVIGQRLHIFGNSAGAASVMSVSAKLDGNGDLGPWKEEYITFSDGNVRPRGSLVWEFGGFLYLLGGTVFNVKSSQILSTSVDPVTGNFGIWRAVGEHPFGFVGPTGGINSVNNVAVKFRDRVLMVGGNCDVPVAPTSTGATFALELVPGGSVGAWQKLDDCPNPASLITTAMIGNRLFAVGGVTTGAAAILDTVSMTKLG